MYLTPSENHWACDIEADNLLDKATTIWCAHLINVVTKEEYACRTAKEFKTFQEKNPTAIFVGHNFLAYDMPMLVRFWKAAICAGSVVDTFVMSQIYNPTFTGGHSLEAWGKRLNYHKLDFNDFSRWTPEMAYYCRKDTILAALLFRKLAERMTAVGFSERGLEVEHLAWDIIQNHQRLHGFPFNQRKALELYVTLRQREEELQNEIYKLWPPRLQVVGRYKKSRKKNGEFTKDYQRHTEQFVRVEETDDGGYQVHDYVSFNLGSPSQRVDKLLSLGWQPTQLTKAGNPKVDEDALLEFAESSDTPEVKALAKWIVINSRANMVNTWLESYNEKTGAIHGKLFIASTLRYRHNSPNSANIPAVRLKKDDKDVENIQYGEAGGYSYESRDLWTCGDTNEWSLVGIDGTGIQNRCLIHGLIKTVGEEAVADFKELALAGDVHKRNIEVLGLANKAAAKKFYYTLMMGGGGARLAADQAQFGTKLTSRQGDALKKMMIESIPGFKEFIAALTKELEDTGRITLCDDTPILVPSPHMVIPYKLQGDESRLMKQAMIYVFDEIRRNGLEKDVFKVADIHDEWQFRVRTGLVDTFTNLALPCFPRAGESFGYLIPITGDFKVGKTWAETH